MPRIFISYRSSDAVALAGRIYDRLRAKYGDDSLFLDRESIPCGADWTDRLGQALERADVLVAVIGPRWLEGVANPNDYVRREVEVALQRKIVVIPLLLASSMPRADDLPPSLRGLCDRQAMQVTPGADFHHQMDRLIDALATIFPEMGIAEAPKPSDRPPRYWEQRNDPA